MANLRFRMDSFREEERGDGAETRVPDAKNFEFVDDSVSDLADCLNLEK